MMQFIANGPDVPDLLLQTHEEGRVVFFCGSGISCLAGLPDYKGLVDAIYRRVGTTPDDALEKQAYDHYQYDTVLDLLERRLPGHRAKVREALPQVLKPNLRRKGATATHTALLQLGCSRNGAIRLVTTNYDRIFVHVTERRKLAVPVYFAPCLPVPKDSRWNGLVYLHGLLPKSPDEIALNRLVLTSGDFGLAYLTERWAARFVSELFRNYMVCFVGYSINDTVLRYMMDALAADRMQGESAPQAYAFGAYAPGEEEKRAIEWEAKGVTPILYEVSSDKTDHSTLHDTLNAWANVYRDGILGKERIVVDCAMTHPSASTQQDDFVGRMLWALSDESGLPAERFANFEPAPPLDWLEVFSRDRYGQSDLRRFGVPGIGSASEDRPFSLLDRPACYARTPRMRLVSAGPIESRWDNIMPHMAHWLVRHLDDPKLVLWLAQQGGQLHERLMWLVESRLRECTRLEREENANAIARIRAGSPSAIPRRLLRPVWHLFLTNCVKSPTVHVGFDVWKERLARDGLTATLRIALRELLAPKIRLKEPFRWWEDESKTEVSESLRKYIDWDLVLTTDHVHQAIRNLATNKEWQEALPMLLDDFQQLLRDALDLLGELGDTDDRSDRSHWYLSSISPHWQNRGFHDWVALIELVRDAWLAVRANDSTRAANIAQGWFTAPYPTWKRLALFAASQEGLIAPDQWVDWLVSDDAWWLWSVDTKRETMRLLVLQGSHLTQQARDRLETAILFGPPRAMYRDDIDPKWWQDLVDHSIWLRLSKLKSLGGALGSTAGERLGVLSAANPEWHLAENEQDEFSSWMSGTGDPDFSKNWPVQIVPRNRRGLAEWLKRTPPSNVSYYQDTWQETCRSRFFHCAFALCDVAKEGLWPSNDWSRAFYAWGNEAIASRSWRFIAPLVQTMPDDVLKDVAHSIAWWLAVASESLNCHEDIFLGICQRILALPHSIGVDTDRPVTQAINHPVGEITEALLNRWFGQMPNDDDELPAYLKPILTQLCDTSVAQYRHGRVLLASYLIALFRVDTQWTKDHLLPLFDWTLNVIEARAAWEGFLRSPRLYRPLLIVFKSQFLDTAQHYEKLREHAPQFATLLTYAALEPVETYTTQDLRAAFEALPQTGLDEAAQALVQALDGASEQREDYWDNRIQPFWQRIWPKSDLLASKSIAESLARLSIAAGARFPEALNAIAGWLSAVEHLDLVVRPLRKSGLCGRFPGESLRLLDAIVGDQPWPYGELRECLDAIAQASPALLQDPHYKRLEEYCRRHGL